MNVQSCVFQIGPHLLPNFPCYSCVVYCFAEQKWYNYEKKQIKQQNPPGYHSRSGEARGVWTCISQKTVTCHRKNTPHSRYTHIHTEGFRVRNFPIPQIHAFELGGSWRSLRTHTDRGQHANPAPSCFEGTRNMAPLWQPAMQPLGGKTSYLVMTLDIYKDPWSLTQSQLELSQLLPFR